MRIRKIKKAEQRKFAAMKDAETSVPFKGTKENWEKIIDEEGEGDPKNIFFGEMYKGYCVYSTYNHYFATNKNGEVVSSQRTSDRVENDIDKIATGGKTTDSQAQEIEEEEKLSHRIYGRLWDRINDLAYGEFEEENPIENTKFASDGYWNLVYNPDHWKFFLDWLQRKYPTEYAEYSRKTGAMRNATPRRNNGEVYSNDIPEDFLESDKDKGSVVTEEEWDRTRSVKWNLFIDFIGDSGSSSVSLEYPYTEFKNKEDALKIYDSINSFDEAKRYAIRHEEQFHFFGHTIDEGIGLATKVKLGIYKSVEKMGRSEGGFEAQKTFTRIGYGVKDDIIRQGNKWVNKGKEGTHGTFATKKAARQQQKAMFARGYKGDAMEDDISVILRQYVAKDGMHLLSTLILPKRMKILARDSGGANENGIIEYYGRKFDYRVKNGDVEVVPDNGTLEWPFKDADYSVEQEGSRYNIKNREGKTIVTSSDREKTMNNLSNLSQGKPIEDEDEMHICVICGKHFRGYPNNAEPVEKGYCCDECNRKYVIPARIKGLKKDSDVGNISVIIDTIEAFSYNPQTVRISFDYIDKYKKKKSFTSNPMIAENIWEYVELAVEELTNDAAYASEVADTYCNVHGIDIDSLYE